MPDSLSFVDLGARLRAGDEDAAAKVFELYAQRLIDLARTRLQEQLQAQGDSNGTLQAVFNSFLRRASAGRAALSDWNSLWTIPVVVTLRKSGRSVPCEPSGPAGCLALESINREPLDSEAAQLVATLEEVQRNFDAEDRQIVVLSLQGLRPAEISVELHLTERRVYRVLDRLRSRLQQLRDED